MLHSFRLTALELKRTRQERDPSVRPVPVTKQPTRSSQRRIRCPKCSWEPDGKPYWQCERCLTMFDTFATRAHCPKCDNSWTWTQCIRCEQISNHEDWYVEEEEEGPA